MEDFGTIHRLPIISSEPDNDTEDSSVNKCSTEPTTTLTNQEQASDTLFTHKHSVTYFPSDTPTQHLENILCIPIKTDRPKPICSVSDCFSKHQKYTTTLKRHNGI